MPKPFRDTTTLNENKLVRFFDSFFFILFFSRHNNNYTESVLIMLDSEDIYSLNTKITIRLGNKHKDDFYSQINQRFSKLCF